MRTRAARWIAGALLAATIVAPALPAAESVVQIRLRGRYYPEPATILVTVAVAPDASNRSLIVAADGDRLFRSSEVSLDGAQARRVHTVEFKNLPAGEYVLRAEVRSSGDVRGTAEEQLTVVGAADHR